MERKPGDDIPPTTTGGRAERYYRALGQAIDEHPDELAVIKDHLRKQVEGRPRLPKPNPNDPKTLLNGAKGYHELLVSLLESDRCRNALKVLEESHQEKLTEGSGEKLLIAAFVGLGIGAGVCIADALFGDPGGICF